MAALLAAPDLPPADLAATGIVLARSADRSVVLLRSGGRSRAAASGETAFGGRVVSVSADSAVLQYGERTIEVRLPQSVGPSALAAVAARPATASAGTSRELMRSDLQKRLPLEVPRIMAETALVPVIEAGGVAGFTIARLPEGTLLSEAGLRAGDVVTRINGTAIDGMATLIGLWPRLQSESVVQADILRDGQPLSLTVTLR